jgi:hypothetical protein
MKPLEFSSEHFGALAADVVDLSVEYLSTLDARPIIPRKSGAETQRLFAGEAPEHGMGDQAFDALREVIAHSRAQNGRFFGYVQENPNHSTKRSPRGTRLAPKSMRESCSRYQKTLTIRSMSVMAMLQQSSCRPRQFPSRRRFHFSPRPTLFCGWWLCV